MTDIPFDYAPLGVNQTYTSNDFYNPIDEFNQKVQGLKEKSQQATQFVYDRKRQEADAAELAKYQSDQAKLNDILIKGQGVINSAPSAPLAGGGGAGGLPGSGAGLGAVPTVPSSKDGESIARDARGYAGVPYVVGGRSAQTGWDCAGYTYALMKQRGISIPQVSWLQIKQGNKVANGNDLSKAKPGDLLFFFLADGHRRSLVTNHVGVYLGNGMMSHAANPRRGTQTVKLDNYYMSQMVQVRRYGRLDQPNPTKASKAIITPSTPNWIGIQAKLNGIGW